MKLIEKRLVDIARRGNMRRIPSPTRGDGVAIDLSSNDYLGLASDEELLDRFLSSLTRRDLLFTSSSSRLLASRQDEYYMLEDEISRAYRRKTLLFNSGYHANTGIIASLGSKSTLFVADKLVHASIIDGMNLAAAAGSVFMRFRHNDFAHLEKIITSHGAGYDRVVIIAESVYSMDGDTTDIDALVRAKALHPGAMIYLDEAHSVGVLGQNGLGMAFSHPAYDSIDIVVGTFGKALASMGAFAVCSEMLHTYLVNTARSLIFSTALPPLTARWSLATFRHSLQADDRRSHLFALARLLAASLSKGQPITSTTDTSSQSPDWVSPLLPGHIQPLIVGDPERAVALSQRLAENGYRVLPIRTPTVPPGTDRLRFSLSAAISHAALTALPAILQGHVTKF